MTRDEYRTVTEKFWWFIKFTWVDMVFRRFKYKCRWLPSRCCGSIRVIPVMIVVFSSKRNGPYEVSIRTVNLRFARKLNSQEFQTLKDALNKKFDGRFESNSTLGFPNTTTQTQILEISRRLGMKWRSVAGELPLNIKLRDCCQHRRLIQMISKSLNVSYRLDPSDKA